MFNSEPPFTGESVEENANVVVRLLIRRPECFGPALRGEGGAGLLAAMEDAIKISEDPARDGPTPKKDRRFMYCFFLLLSLFVSFTLHIASYLFLKKKLQQFQMNYIL